MGAEQGKGCRSAFQLLHNLPSELLQQILTYLDATDLTRLNLASKWTNNTATPLLWRHVTLVDRTSTPAHPSLADGSDCDPLDHHDDTPLLRKLLILATNPWIASHVQVLEHRCHCPPPGIFAELPRTTLSGMTMSCDPRTWELVRLAVKGMQRVHTVRIINGHVQLVDVLLRSFFDPDREKQTPVRRLWLEGCRIAAACDLNGPRTKYGDADILDFTGLETLRLRRLPLKPGMGLFEVVPRHDFVLARGGTTQQLQDGQGGTYLAVTNDPWDETRGASGAGLDMDTRKLVEIFSFAIERDDQIFEALGEEIPLPEALSRVRDDSIESRAWEAWRGPLIDPLNLDELSDSLRLHQRERLPSARVALNLLQSARTTLTSLCLDWVLAMPHNLATSISKAPQKYIAWLETYADLFSLRFPNLRAFQYRNAVTIDTVLPTGIFLLDHAAPILRNADLKLDVPAALLKRLDLACLEFMEAHPNLQCLAWPMEAFFSAFPINPDIADRVAAVVDNLGRTLVDLRVDTMYNPTGERQTEDSACSNPAARGQRRRFIAGFAFRMTKVTSIKVEGGMPRDERREVLRALHRCPLEKVVLIGVCCPIGNTWGIGAMDLISSAGGPGGAAGHLLIDFEDLEVLEAEHKDAVHRSSYTAPDSSAFELPFTPSYGWPPGPPMLHTIASLPSAAQTITSLKFCGYKGAPVLYTPTPITPAILAPLKHFHALRDLVMSFCLLTGFEGQGRDCEIIRYWLDARSPSTTSLVLVRHEDDDAATTEMGSWERELKTKFAPEALAGEVVRVLGPCLSERAKATSGGVRVRASVCLGEWGGIFDLDVVVGKDGGSAGGGRDVCLAFEGPREELEEGRRRGKLEGRRWF